MATSAAVQGASLITGVWKKLEKAIYHAGGTDEHLARLAKDETDSAFANFAAEIVRGGGTANSFADQIRAGRYNYRYGFAASPAGIQGQVFHPVVNEIKLDCPDVRFTSKQIHKRYGDKMADLSELLDFGINHPEIQRQVPVAIVWLVGDKFWFAVLFGDSSRRRLHIRQGHPRWGWVPNYYHFLIRS